MRILFRLPSFTFLVFIAITLAACTSGRQVVTSPEDIQKQAFDDLRTEVRKTVNDSVRQTEVIALIDQMQSDFKSMRNSVVKRKSEVRKLFADYDTPHEKFDEQIIFYDTQVKSNRKRFGDSRRALVEATTIEEWTALNKAESKAMSALAKSLMSI